MAKIACFLVVVVLMPLMAWAAYPAEFQQLDTASFINDQKRVVNVLECLVHEKCSGEDKIIKDSLVQSFRSLCNDCDPEVKTKVRNISKHFVVNHNDKWTEVVRKYDPKLEHAAAFKKFLEEN